MAGCALWMLLLAGAALASSRPLGIASGSGSSSGSGGGVASVGSGGNCVEHAPTMGWDPAAGCKRCNADASRCEACFPYFYLDPASGQCQPCRVPGEFGGYCQACDPAAPEVCLPGGCSNLLRGTDTTAEFGETFTTGGGTCEPCNHRTKGCVACDDGQGACTQCDFGRGLIDGECMECTVPHCARCGGSPDRCLVCEQTGEYFLDAASASCQPALWHGPCDDPACLVCSEAPSKCSLCPPDRPLDPVSGACVPCADSRCAYCPDRPDVCLYCTGSAEQGEQDGYAADLLTGTCDRSSTA